MQIIRITSEFKGDESERRKFYLYRNCYHENVNMRKKMFSNVQCGSWENIKIYIETDVDMSGGDWDIAKSLS